MSNRAYVYQRRLVHAVARLSEVVQISRFVSGTGVVIVTIQPLIVPATAAIQTVVATGASTTPSMAAQYAGFGAQAVAGDSFSPAAGSGTSTTTKTQVLPTLLIVQDYAQAPAAEGDTFVRDGQTWTVVHVANQLIAGIVIAVLAIAQAPAVP